MRIAIVGCGFVADLYMQTLRKHRDLELIGAWDSEPTRLFAFSRRHAVSAYTGIEELLEDGSVETVLNLTNPHSHFAVSRACLDAGKNVYSEKPLAMCLEDADSLVALASERKLHLSSAPSRLLGRPAQTLWRAIRSGTIGPVYLVYAEMDDGLLHRMGYRRWVTASGANWPHRDELVVGNTIEHAGYALTWLAAFFGPARRVTAFASRVVPEKHMDVPLSEQAPDFSVAAIEFESGVVARLTCSIVARHDHRIRIFGENGILSVDDCWEPESAVRVRRRLGFRGGSHESPWAMRLPLLGDDEARQLSRKRKKVDFCLGPVDLARAIREQRPPRLSSQFCLHITEISLAITAAMSGATSVAIKSRFAPIEPMPWAN
jgi:predicted dehydrogenase